ncbi:MAG: 16S rRNA (cytosine(1402)-N(4))-methyltransferase RsmH [Candidatus Moranbacteria bacterium]|nr:16S rRNA (cytosine(1402)-N(4))-methyltransferase RsmH [Candidatus Moranbacteria bacterium]
MRKHQPVLLKPVIENLRLKKNGVIVDCTLGDGGHCRQIAQRMGKKGLVIALDYDRQNIKRFEKLNIKNVKTVWANFKDIDLILRDLKIKKVDGFLLDLGFSSRQLDTVEGLSFQENGFLSMVLDKTQNNNRINAAFILNNFSKKQLQAIFREYGEIRNFKEIVEKIIRQRKVQEFQNTGQLKKIVESCNFKEFNRKKIHPATKVFMALRIAVNQEIENLKIFLNKFEKHLKTKGRICVITFHSLEDRIVKKYFQRQAKKCICSEDEMICNCSHKPSLKIITKKPIRPAKAEIFKNPKSRSAKLRIAQKI